MYSCFGFIAVLVPVLVEVASEGLIATGYALLAAHAHVAARELCLLYVVIFVGVVARVLLGCLRIRRVFHRLFTRGSGPVAPVP